jgi:hypothetical protein
MHVLYTGIGKVEESCSVYRSIVRWKNGCTVDSRWWDGRFMYCIQQVVKWKMHVSYTADGGVEECIYCILYSSW